MTENKKQGNKENEKTAGSGSFHFFILWLFIFMIFGCILAGALLTAK